jgi:hypothetical protein
MLFIELTWRGRSTPQGVAFDHSRSNWRFSTHVTYRKRERIIAKAGEKFVQIGAGEGPLKGSGGLLVVVLEGEQMLLEFSEGGEVMTVAMYSTRLTWAPLLNTVAARALTECPRALTLVTRSRYVRPHRNRLPIADSLRHDQAAEWRMMDRGDL